MMFHEEKLHGAQLAISRGHADQRPRYTSHRLADVCLSACDWPSANGSIVLRDTDTDEAQVERQRVALGFLPQRYAERWADPFIAALEPALTPSARVLDVGSGRRPTIAPEERPAGCEYVGMDISPDELEAAASGSYGEVVVADITTRVPDLEDRFDLVISWQVLEHVESLPDAFANFHAYLRPGGRTVNLLSGRYAIFAILARIVPYGVAVQAMDRLLGIRPESRFPTRYDKCYYSALSRLLDDWSAWDIIPRYKGGTYFRFSRPLERAYLAYENMISRTDCRNLATHYVLSAMR
jgi:SAM-dependent methyltransferase